MATQTSITSILLEVGMAIALTLNLVVCPTSRFALTTWSLLDAALSLASLAHPV
jgi:hypothetical protein